MSATLHEPKIAPAPREITTVPRFSDKVFRGVVSAGGLSTLLILALIAFFLVYNGFEVFRAEGLKFLTGFDWIDAIPEEGIAANDKGFYEHWGWYCTLDELSKGDVLKFNQLLELNVVEFLNWLAYLKDKNKWQEQKAMLQKY